MSEHRYHEDIEGEFLVREFILQEVHPRTALLCPKDFAIAKIAMLIQTGPDIIEKFPDHKLDIPYAHWLIKPDDGVPTDEERGTTKCPTLQKCLGYQACLFNFGIEFCHMDPVPGQRKNLGVNLTCVRDDELLKSMLSVNYEAEFVHEVFRRTKLVLHLTYNSRLEETLPELTSTEVKEREESESEVFHATCPDLERAMDAGYRGHCHKEPPAPTEVSEGLWALLGRVPSRVCREELQQIYCSFLYQNKGLCLPPFVLEPGHARDLGPEKLHLAANSFPKSETRPDLTSYAKVLQDPKKDIIPARLGFVILAHKDPPALMQLLRLIYRPQHHYVIHVDKRREDTRSTLIKLIAKLMPGAKNIRVLPVTRSFVASWGSYNIVRAELEAFEELLRMGIWDFAVKLSGADLPLRDVDDLSATLAPYRGENYVPLFGHRNRDMKAEQGLVWDVWHGCEGYVYNVTKAGGQPHPEEIPIYTGSQWSIMGRDLTHYAVTHERRSDQLNRWHYHLQMSIIPDEAYFPTITMNSPYVNKSRPLGFHWLKKFEGRNTINLCRHMEDADFCGQGPGPVEEDDLREMMESSHRYFFARKFHTDNPGHSTRIRVTEHVRTNYYLSLRRHIPRGLLKQLADLAFVRLEQDLRAHPVLGSLTISPGDVTAFKVLPRLHLTNPCCSLPFERSFKSTQEFVFWVDFNISMTSSPRPQSDETGSSVAGARALVAQRAVCDCYPDGHLRALRVTTWPEDPTSPRRILYGGRRSALTTNVPLPFVMPGADTVYVELWFHVGPRSLSEDCKRKIRPTGRPMEFGNMNVQETKADPLDIVVQVIDPNGNVRCEERKTDHWDLQHVHPNRDFERVEMPSFFTVLCGTMEPGKWTLRVFQDGVQDARHYELPLVVLPSSADLPSDPDVLQRIDLLQDLWTIEKVTLLPLSDYYGDSPRLPLRDSKRPTLSPRDGDKSKKPQSEKEKKEEEKLEKQKRDDGEEKKRKKKKEENEEEEKKREKGEGEIKEEMRAHVKDVHLPPRSRRSAEDELHFGFHHDDPVFSVREWVLCSGGLLTTSLTLVFTYHWLILPALYGVRPSPRMRRSALLVLMSILMQIVVCALYCR
ncbi:uncharacterized protein LOC125042200 isoform X1 [Penaeus chinensis]|uniref:uncharacterized protein LOC125042200 isoform X1 n=1 Tax=Penaeus chinensis TaxID=139456 RepID=UPI001FB730AB|nr:uncharacterized protein LOC125042200 isoform X1 [Penaeus chinensis]